MGICDSTMRLNTFLLAMAVLLYGAESTVKSRAYFNETGDLPCHFINSQNISVDNLVAFWQDQDKRVLYELYGGKENQKNVHPAYKGRTSLDLDNWTLRLHNVQIKDTGLYQCFIHHKGPHGLVSTHQKSCDLSVFDADAKSPKPPPRPPGHDTLIAVLLLLLLLIVCGPVLCSVLKNKKKKQPGPSRECETTEMEGEESEQAKKRVENRVPGRSDEAQCVVNISKTASGQSFPRSQFKGSYSLQSRAWPWYSGSIIKGRQPTSPNGRDLTKYSLPLALLQN
ncbi:PREDICTED: T-lymphocyte activation antigen CD86 isoform X5 [Hipposideros armiger]|uniref:T-lymphocyte activation antigen CD86 isoform X5 n=1 Tax=Hipposideros armiger TaxID=186990 RepID=A0A8B7S2Z2_HIPAR|nr:PREDICTED: T-lymphocyte activation antigen CD86 isoform X5 [Hipposideros armiger]